MGIFNIDHVKIGKRTYGRVNVLDFGTENILKIGSYCSIGPNVAFVLCAEHPINTVSSFPFRVKIMGEQFEAISKGNIIVDDDVWFGYGAIVMSGVHIGQGAVIAAGSVVTKDVPPYAVVGGCPAKIIKYRFTPDIIEEMLKIDFNKISDDFIMQHIDDLYRPVDIASLDWLPKKS